MKSTAFTTIRFILAAATVLAILAKPHIPPRTLLLHPSSSTITSIYSAGDREKSAVRWVDRGKHAWRCDHESAGGELNCGFTMSWGLPDANCVAEIGHPQCQDPHADSDGDGWGWEQARSCRVAGEAQAGAKTELARKPASGCSIARVNGATSAAVTGVDFSLYDGLSVDIHYAGRASFLRLFLLNHNPDYPQNKSPGYGKFMSAYVRTEDLKAGPAFVELSEFNVAEWWVLMTDVPRQLAAPEFDRVVAMGIDHTETGVHAMRVERIELVGEWITWRSFLSLLIAFWLVVLVLEGVIRYYTLYRTSRARQARIAELSGHYSRLEQQSPALADSPMQDALTGLCSRAGIAQHMRVLEGGDMLPCFGVLVIDIDHFKRINDIHGRETGDQVLRECAQLLGSNVRDGDILARWGGEEFILIAKEVSRDALMKIAEKLRGLVADTSFGALAEVRLTVSVGATCAESGDDFTLTLKRADVALYRAKSIRNCVAYE